MLSFLSIRDIVLIDALDLTLDQGLTVLTGETGAGKSILLDALGLATGGRADRRLVRHGAGQGSVTAGFTVRHDHPVRALLAEADLRFGEGEENESDSRPPSKGEPVAGAGEVILRRVQRADGPSRAFINDQPVSAALLQRAGALLLDIHGQHDDRDLLNPASHRSLLDLADGIGPLKAVAAQTFAAWRDAREALEARRARLNEAEADRETLTHLCGELRLLDPRSGEETELAEERRRGMTAEKIREDVQEALDALGGRGGLGERIGTALRRLERAEHGAIAMPAIEALDHALSQAEEAQGVLETMLAGSAFDTDRHGQVEERLFALRAAARKHRCAVEDLPRMHANLEADLAAIETGQADLEALETALTRARQDYERAADRLSQARIKAAGVLDEAVAGELAPLKLGRARFRTGFEILPQEQWGAEGWDRVRFEISTNPGAPFGPLSRIASGGEMARFMLALKVTLARQRPPRTLIFDEIDQGVGGAVAAAMGERLARLAAITGSGGAQDGCGQVLVVTHAPQVAARANHHIRIQKATSRDGVRTVVAFLDAEDRREEIARMLAGEHVTPEARAAAQQLLAPGAQPHGGGQGGLGRAGRRPGSGPAAGPTAVPSSGPSNGPTNRQRGSRRAKDRKKDQTRGTAGGRKADSGGQDPQAAAAGG